MRAQPRLPVTVCAVDTLNPLLALRALDLTLQQFAAADAVFLTDQPQRWQLPGCRIEAIAPIRSAEEYSRFVLKGLAAHVRTSHVLLIQWDGYVTHAAAWDDAFLDCDYIGAPFPRDVPPPYRVGNGGFSLRSRRLLEALADPLYVAQHPEDVAICRRYRPRLESHHGIRFADEALARRFSVEAGHYPEAPTFGFHGLFNLWLFLPAHELPEFVATLDPVTVRGIQYLRLCRNYLELGRRDEARVALERRVAVDPGDREAAALLAAAPSAVPALPAARPAAGAFSIRTGWGAPPPAPAAPDPEALFRAALEAHRRGDRASAEAGYRRVLAAAPAHPPARHYLGVLLLQGGAVAAAAPWLESSLPALMHQPDAHNNLGLLRRAQGRLDDAVAAYERALVLAPDYAPAWNNLGLDALALGAVPRALAACERALALQPDFAEAHWNRGLALLTAGELRAGFAEYEWRWRCDPFATPLPAALAQVPEWRGEDPAGRTLLLRAEQGAGDTLQFIRYAEALADRGARVLAAVPAALAALVATAPGVAGVVADTAGLATAPPVDAHVRLLSLPQRLGTELATIPARVPYLAVPAGRVAPQPLVRAPGASGTADAGLRVGLVWAGSATHANDRQRSLPLAALAPLLALRGVRWFSLQKGAAAEAQLAEFPAVVPLGAHLGDFADTAAAVAALDLVISVDTAVAHLAGALGKPCWVLLPFAADWRWLRERSDTPWYPSLRLWRQPVRGDWAAPVTAMVAALRQRIDPQAGVLS